ncbi:hypothetical protein T484DRAFT_3642942 [Baffinella frigidus]|nr:hypothetical protein T484DRAFT_3642942 [Cryptophyta sp. CCMP2293]
MRDLRREDATRGGELHPLKIADHAGYIATALGRCDDQPAAPGLENGPVEGQQDPRPPLVARSGLVASPPIKRVNTIRVRRRDASAPPTRQRGDEEDGRKKTWAEVATRRGMGQKRHQLQHLLGVGRQAPAGHSDGVSQDQPRGLRGTPIQGEPPWPLATSLSPARSSENTFRGPIRTVGICRVFFEVIFWVVIASCLVPKRLWPSIRRRAFLGPGAAGVVATLDHGPCSMPGPRADLRGRQGPQRRLGLHQPDGPLRGIHLWRERGLQSEPTLRVL